MILYSTSKVSIRLVEEQEYIEQSVKGFISSDELKTFQNELLGQCKQHKVEKILCDTRELKVVRSEDMAWMVSNIRPYLQQCGIRYFAIISPQNVFGQIAVNLFTESDGSMQIRLFETKEQAVVWLGQAV